MIMAKKREGFSKEEFSALKLAWELGYTITIPLVILVLVGRFLDKRFDTSPIFLLAGILLSMITSVVGIYRTVKPILSKFEREDKELKNEKTKKLKN
jgi:F0F1-type ATP synthase assembly protein I